MSVRVSPLTPLSDHSKITANLHRPTPNQGALKPNKLHTINKCYRWKKSSVETYQNTINQNYIQTLLDNFLDQNFQCNNEWINMAVESLNNIFDISALQSKLKVSNSQSRNKNNIDDKWFDDECKSTRKTLRNLSNQKHRDPDNNNIVSIIMRP